MGVVADNSLSSKCNTDVHNSMGRPHSLAGEMNVYIPRSETGHAIASNDTRIMKDGSPGYTASPAKTQPMSPITLEKRPKHLQL